MSFPSQDSVREGIAPGTLHHVMVRGIEGNCIVTDDEERHFFVSRMGKVAAATGTSIYAWALMTNHAHILLKSGGCRSVDVHAQIAVRICHRDNLRHKRQCHLFQNRYKLIVCEEEPYFLRLVSYIHLNLLRAGLAESLEDLECYPWSGHAVVMNRIRHEWQDRNYVFGYFGKRESFALQAYREFLAEESGHGRQPELTGYGLVRSIGGWSEVKGEAAGNSSSDGSGGTACERMRRGGNKCSGAEGRMRERTGFRDVVKSPESQALQSLFSLIVWR
jgi:putative transposase